MDVRTFVANHALPGRWLDNGSFQTNCPCHADDKASLNIANGNDGKLLLYDFAGCKYHDIAAKYGIPVSRVADGRKLDKVYTYTDETGLPVYETVKYLLPDGSKTFTQRHKVDGKYVYKMNGVKALPYNLPGLLQAIRDNEIIQYPEGEKNADDLMKHGFIATASHGGANNTKAVDAIAPFFKGCDVVLHSDNDEAGRKFTEYRIRALKPYAERIRVVEYPELPEKGDVSDFFSQGGTFDSLVPRIAKAIDGDQWLAMRSQQPETPEAQADQQPDNRKLYTIDELAQIPAPNFLDDNKEIPERALMLTSGSPGSGKTAVTLYDALKIAQSKPAVYVAGEGLEAVIPRVLAARRYFKLSTDLLRLRIAPFNLMKDDEVTAFIADITPFKPVYVVIDNLALSSGEAKENTDDMKIVCANALRIVREVGCTVDLIHHNRKDTDTYRGHTSIAGFMDVMRSITNYEGVIKIRSEKTRRTAPFETRIMEITVEGDCFVLLPHKRGQDTGRLSQLHLDILQAANIDTFKSGIRVSQMKSILNIPKSRESTFYTALAALKRRALLSQINDKGAYFITAAGKAMVTPAQQMELTGDTPNDTPLPETVSQSANYNYSKTSKTTPDGVAQPSDNSTPVTPLAPIGAGVQGVVGVVAKKESKTPRSKRSKPAPSKSDFWRDIAKAVNERDTQARKGDA